MGDSSTGSERGIGEVGGVTLGSQAVAVGVLLGIESS